jgi:hypothetical protein
MSETQFTPEEKGQLDSFLAQAKEGEFAQINDLFINCSSPYQFAKTHSVYVKDWEVTKARLEDGLKTGKLPPGISANFQRALIDSMDDLIERKLMQMRSAFETKFGESIYNYLGKDGKTKGFFG